MVIPSINNQLKLGLACLTVAGVVGWVNRYHEVQSGIYGGRYQGLARFFLGETEQSIITYPLWGYPLLLSWLPRPEVTSIVLQLIISTIALLLVYTSAAPYLRFRSPLVTLCIIAVPWYALASVKLADIYAASFGVMAICLLSQAVKKGNLRWSMASGLLFGASMNFRSDFVPFLAIFTVLIVVLAPKVLASNWRQLAIVIIIAVVSLVPWGLFRVYHGKSFGITSTNSGMVLYNSLGFPGNSWQIIGSDKLRSYEVKHTLGPEVDPASEEGNAFFHERFLAAVTSDPFEFCRKVAYNFVSIFKLGFYGIENVPFLSEKERLEFAVLKAQLKLLAGARQSPMEVERFRDMGVWDEAFSIASITPRQWAIIAFPIANTALSALYLAMLLSALIWILLCGRTWLHEPISLFCLVATISVFSLLSFMQYEPRQANVLYPLGMPLIAILMERLIGARETGLRRGSKQ